MLDGIGEASGQYRNYLGILSSRVEILRQGETAKSDSDVGGQTRNRTKLEDGKIIIETYTKNGELVKITPPGYLPFDKIE